MRKISAFERETLLDCIWFSILDSPSISLKEVCKEMKITVKYVKLLAKKYSEWKDLFDRLDEEERFPNIIQIK